MAAIVTAVREKVARIERLALESPQSRLRILSEPPESVREHADVSDVVAENRHHRAAGEVVPIPERGWTKADTNRYT